MATPTAPSKRYYAAGATKGAAWGTAVALGASKGILLTNDGAPALKRAYLAHEDIDAVMQKDGDLGDIAACDFSPDCDARYDPGPLGGFLAAIFGTAGVPSGMYVVTTSNNKIDFKEGEGSELTAEVAAGTYTGTALAVAIAAAFNATETKELTWGCTYSAATNKFTITVSATATVCWSTGTHKETDISTLCGYSDLADDTGDGPFVSDTAGLGTAMKHVLQWADENSAFFTFAVERPGTIWEVPSAMPFKYQLKISGGIVKETFTLRGNTVIATSAVNTLTQMDALTYADRGNRIKFSHGAIWMNAESDGALSASDALDVSDLEINLERQPDDVHAAGSETILLPRDKGFKMSVKLTLPRTSATNLAYLATFLATTAQKMSIVFTSPVVAGASVYYSRAYHFPRLKFVEPPAAPLDDIMKTTINLEAEEAATAPTGMDYVRPYAELVNLQTTDYLADPA